MTEDRGQKSDDGGQKVRRWEGGKVGATFSCDKELLGTVNPTISIHPINSVNLSTHFAFTPSNLQTSGPHFPKPLSFNLLPCTFHLLNRAAISASLQTEIPNLKSKIGTPSQPKIRNLKSPIESTRNPQPASRIP